MLIDTSGLLCIHHKDEPLHAQAVALFKQARQRVIHSYILAEFVPLCQARGLNRSAALAFAKELALSDQLRSCGSTSGSTERCWSRWSDARTRLTPSATRGALA